MSIPSLILPKYFISHFSRLIFHNWFLIPLYIFTFLSPYINDLFLSIDCHLPCPFNAILLTLSTFPYIANVIYAHSIYLIHLKFSSILVTHILRILEKIPKESLGGSFLLVYIPIGSSYTMKNKAVLFSLPQNVRALYQMLINCIKVAPVQLWRLFWSMYMYIVRSK